MEFKSSEESECKEHQNTIIAGKLRNHQTFWNSLTTDTNILNIIQGYQIEFTMKPYQYKPRITPIPKNMEKAKVIQDEINSLLQKQAILPVQSHPKEFISIIFLVPKKSGGMRPIINLKPLNRFIETIHFKMETLQTVLNLIQEGYFLISMDLKDAYFSIPIHLLHRKYLRFIWRNQTYEFQCLPFGLKSAPRIFTECTKPLMAFLRTQGHRGVIYIDDSLWLAQTITQAQEMCTKVLKVFQKAGFVINQQKSILIPSQKILFLGYLIDTVEMKVFLPQEKIKLILIEIRKLLSSVNPKIQVVAHVIGLIVSAFPAIYQGPLYYRSLEKDKTSALFQNQLYQAQMMLSQDSQQELFWWIHNMEGCNGKPIHFQDPSIVITTDASKKGWGCDEQSKGIWQMDTGGNLSAHK